VASEVGLLISAAVSAGILHTLVGPDHYVLFVAMAKTCVRGSRCAFLRTGHAIRTLSYFTSEFPFGLRFAEPTALRLDAGPSPYSVRLRAQSRHLE
jgi:hypothetical protein